MGTGTVNSKMRYLKSLKQKHRQLDEKIERMTKHHQPDNEITVLKKEKLILKTNINELETQIEDEL
jgi:hypothetical protein